MCDMKKISLILITVLITSLGLQASRYEVFRIKGSVMIEHNGKWHTLPAHSPLENSSRLKIESGATLSIKDNDTKSIYYRTGPEEISVARFIISAKKEMQSKTTSIVKTLGRTVSSDSPQRKSVLGVTNRGGAIAAAEAEGNEEIKVGTLEHFIRTLAQGEVAENSGSYPEIKGKILVDSDSIVSYEIDFPASGSSSCGLSEQEDQYFLNVLKINGAEVPRLIFQSGTHGENISIAAGERIVVDWFPTIFEPGARYLLFVSDTPYRSELLQNTITFIHNGKINAVSGLPLDKGLREASVCFFEL